MSSELTSLLALHIFDVPILCSGVATTVILRCEFARHFARTLVRSFSAFGRISERVVGRWQWMRLVLSSFGHQHLTLRHFLLLIFQFCLS